MTRSGHDPAQAAYPVRWHVMPDPEALVEAVVQRLLAQAGMALAERGVFRIVLAGGVTPEAVYRRLAAAATDWSRWQVYFGDERCLPADHPQRNSVMALQSWLGQVPLPADNIHSIPAELGPEAAARSYARVIEAACPFDLVLLGMGADGHTASLFPDQRHDPAERVHPVHNAPKPPPDRVSLGLAALNDTAEVMVLITGRNKQAAVNRWKAGEDLPVTRVHGQQGVDVFLDFEADGKAV